VPCRACNGERPVANGPARLCDSNTKVARTELQNIFAPLYGEKELL
jgi:hypothetical protein